jgi:hypothetical protein
MSRIFHPLLYLLVSATKQGLIRRIHYLKTENQRLRNRLPKTIWTTPEERRELVKAAQGLTKGALRELVTIVSPATLLRWMNADKKPKSKKKPSSRKPGRPPRRRRNLLNRAARCAGRLSGSPIGGPADAPHGQICPEITAEGRRQMAAETRRDH